MKFFQIIVPIISLLFIIGLVRRYYQTRASWQEVSVGGVFWIGVMLFALFPDFFSIKIAQLFGIESNVNAIIFFCIGLIFFFQYKLFFMIKKQQSALTELVRKLSLEEAEEEQAS
ncbi:MAG: DUF2304 family protein [Bacteroidetes bacterium]|jgi:hypothetical protein|nr:DUF2304 family protein [Bacteroidota bacterium]